MSPRRFLLGLGLLVAGLARGATAPEPDCVVLLHGIGMRGYVMKQIESALTDQGYRVVNISYPSREMPFEQLAGEYLPAQLKAHDVARAPRLNFVTHSLGSLIVRKFIHDARPANLGRVVMIGPPNHGSTAADEAKGFALLSEFLGENLARLGTGENSIARTLGPADFEVGVIAGEVAINPVFGNVLEGKNDGAVTVESAKLEGMRDFIVVPYSHTVMLWRDEVIQQTVTFLREGKFKHAEPAPTPVGQ
jgi:pimeloyl-ACP methyl ester carboxylesterase